MSPGNREIEDQAGTNRGHTGYDGPEMNRGGHWLHDSFHRFEIGGRFLPTVLAIGLLGAGAVRLLGRRRGARAGAVIHGSLTVRDDVVAASMLTTGSLTVATRRAGGRGA